MDKKKFDRDLFVPFFLFSKRGNNFGLRFPIVKAIKTVLEWARGFECADLRNVFYLGIPLNLMACFCSH